MNDDVMLDRLVAAYDDPSLDPSRSAWAKLLADPGFDSSPIAVTEFVRLAPEANAAASYDAWLDALSAAVGDGGGEMVGVHDVMFPGLDEPAGYGGGVAWVATFPSIRAYAAVMLDARVTGAAASRRAAVTAAQVLAGADRLPAAARLLPPNEPASAFPSDRVAGKSGAEIVDAMLQVYPAGGADPTRERLEAIVAHPGFADQRVHYLNLYEFNQDGGEVALNEYNAAAQPAVLAHGARPKVLANVTHHLVGPTPWSRFILVAWPSLAVFMDLRLDPTYIEAQKHRVVSASRYGNLMMISRADKRPAVSPAASKGRGL
jgi:uncharacterized protein (DUF1330 family)